MLAGMKVNWTDEDLTVWEGRFRAGGSKHLLTLLKQHGLPSRLAEALLEEASPEAGPSLLERKVADITKEERASVLRCLTAYALLCNGHEGYPKVHSQSFSERTKQWLEEEALHLGDGVRVAVFPLPI